MQHFNLKLQQWQQQLLSFSSCSLYPVVCVFHQQSFPFLILDLCKDQALFCALQDGAALLKSNTLLGFVWMRKPSAPAKGFSHDMEHGIPWQARGINSHRQKAEVPRSYPVHQPAFITESIINNCCIPQKQEKQTKGNAALWTCSLNNLLNTRSFAFQMKSWQFLGVGSFSPWTTWN